MHLWEELRMRFVRGFVMSCVHEFYFQHSFFFSSSLKLLRWTAPCPCRAHRSFLSWSNGPLWQASRLRNTIHACPGGIKLIVSKCAHVPCVSAYVGPLACVTVLVMIVKHTWLTDDGDDLQSIVGNAAFPKMKITKNSSKPDHGRGFVLAYAQTDNCNFRLMLCSVDTSLDVLPLWRQFTKTNKINITITRNRPNHWWKNGQNRRTVHWCKKATGRKARPQKQ